MDKPVGATERTSPREWPTGKERCRGKEDGGEGPRWRAGKEKRGPGERGWRTGRSQTGKAHGPRWVGGDGTGWASGGTAGAGHITAS